MRATAAILILGATLWHVLGSIAGNLEEVLRHVH
jgi:hypothetical protein